jgi:GNAT superfamily N-acetyltransferase
LEQGAGRPLAWFADRLEADFVLAAWAGEEVRGTAGFRGLQQPKERRKGELFGIYGRPAARRHGIGAALIAAVTGHAAEVAEQRQRAVGTGNAPARRLRARLGFLEWATERVRAEALRRLCGRGPHGEVPAGAVTIVRGGAICSCAASARYSVFHSHIRA